MRKTISILAVMAMVFGMAALAGAVEPDFVEDFEDGNVDGWAWDPQGGNGIIEAVTTPVSPSGGDYVGKVTFAGSCYGPNYHFDPATPDDISWYFRADGDTGHPSGLAVHWYQANGWTMASISYHQGALRYHPEPGWDYVQIETASTGIWYLIELRNIDWDDNTFDIWVDGVEKAAGVPFNQDVDNVSRIQNYACPTATGPSYVDDITFDSDDGGPVVTDVVASLNPSPVAQPVTISATVDDTLTGNSMIASAGYSLDGEPYLPMSASDGAFDTPTEAVEAALGSFETPDVHTLCVRGTDTAGNTSTEECTFLAVYDPDAGFVTGGGWIDSPAGAMASGLADLPFYAGHYYDVVSSDLTWAEANAAANASELEGCASAHLATITSQEEQDAIHEAFGNDIAFAWLGAHLEEGEWQWVTGEPWDYTNWQSGEPSATPGENALHVGGGGTSTPEGWIYDGKWNDTVDTWVYPYMVEYEDCGPTGKANFGFVSKYKKGAQVPTGTTEFQFQAGDLNFHSTSYQWLVVTGSDYAKFKGVGTINGAGEFKFQIWAGDGYPDTFRIKIWTEDELEVETVIYDNFSDQALGGGSIVVHTKK